MEAILMIVYAPYGLRCFVPDCEGFLERFVLEVTISDHISPIKDDTPLYICSDCGKLYYRKHFVKEES
jgi:hypothetical protein